MWEVFINLTCGHRTYAQGFWQPLSVRVQISPEAWLEWIGFTTMEMQITNVSIININKTQ